MTDASTIIEARPPNFKEITDLNYDPYLCILSTFVVVNRVFRGSTFQLNLMDQQICISEKL